MKKIISILLATIILLIPLSGIAVNIPGYEGGIQNEIIYKEVIFVTGQPITMEGTLSIKSKAKDDIVTETYSYKLENKLMNAKLSRSITLKETLETNGGQVRSTKTLDKYKETIDIDKKRYEAKDSQYQWSQGSVSHNTPLLSYHAGHYSARKTYDVDKGNEQLTVDTIGNLVGYDGPWSATETQTIEYILNWEDKTDSKKDFNGTATVETSYNRTKDFLYTENTPSQISFSGGYIVTEKEENVLKYKYDLPKDMQNKTPKGRNQGEDRLYLDTNPNIKSLNIPSVRDALGHEYEEELLLMASMEGLPLESKLIGPSSAMSRGDFARIIVKAMDIPIVKEEVKRSSRRNKVEPTPPLFKDVKASHRNFDYIEEVAKRNIMVGVEAPNFDPDEPLSRMEAYTIVTRILGFENLAPIKNYSLGYKDEDKVQHWAKDYIYVAKELGLIGQTDYLYPNRDLTKGEAAKLMVDLIEYMQDELRYDYREGILND